MAVQAHAEVKSEEVQTVADASAQSDKSGRSKRIPAIEVTPKPKMRVRPAAPAGARGGPPTEALLQQRCDSYQRKYSCLVSFLQQSSGKLDALIQRGQSMPP